MRCGLITMVIASRMAICIDRCAGQLFWKVGGGVTLFYISSAPLSCQYVHTVNIGVSGVFSLSLFSVWSLFSALVQLRCCKHGFLHFVKLYVNPPPKSRTSTLPVRYGNYKQMNHAPQKYHCTKTIGHSG